MSSQPHILNLSINSQATLTLCYMPFMKGKGLFIPTPKAFPMSDRVVIMLGLSDSPAKLTVSGKVGWITPKGAQSRPAGMGIVFDDDPKSAEAIARIEKILGTEIGQSKPTNTL